MSLDVTLVADNIVNLPRTAIFVRKNGILREVTRTEWDELYPGKEPVVAIFPEEDNELYSANITHNLSKMAAKASIYEHLWRPAEIGIERAGQLVKPLRDGLERLRAKPEKFKAFNPANGWGDYEGLVEWIVDYLLACEKYPNARIEISR